MQKIILDVVPNGIEPRVYVNQFDTGRTFQIAFKENFGSYYFPNDVVFRINGRKADNHIFEYSEADKWDATHYVITKSGSGDSLVVTIATTEQMTAAAGEAEVQLTFKSSSASNDILGTLNFILVVQEKPDANGDPSESDIPGLVRSVNGVDPDASGNVLLPPAQGAIGAHNIAPVEPTRIMSTARAAGTQVYVTADDQLYDIISSIASGGTLTPGTNAIASSISSDLASKDVTSEFTISSANLSNFAARLSGKTLSIYGVTVNKSYTGNTPIIPTFPDKYKPLTYVPLTMYNISSNKPLTDGMLWVQPSGASLAYFGDSVTGAFGFYGTYNIA
jgi:hypothetical protein